MGWPRLCIGLLALQAASMPVSAQEAVVHYGERQSVPVAAMPLSLSIAGWSKPDFQQAWRESGTVGNEPTPTITRYEATIAHAGYFGVLLFVDTTRDVSWRAPTPAATLEQWAFFHGKPVVQGKTGQVVNGQMAFDYLLAQVSGVDATSCGLFSGAAAHAQMRGYLCAEQPAPLDGMPGFIGAIGHAGLLTPIPATLPPVRTNP
jgi:hypothetical protein